MRSDELETHPKNANYSRPKVWSGAVKVFHWGSVLLLIVIWLMITLHENSDGDTFIQIHKTLGVCLLLWMIARVISRVITPTPVSVPMPKWQTAMAHISHLALYVLLFAMPISGILMTWYGGKSINMFGLVELPSVLSTDRSQARFFNNLHTDTFWPALLIFTGVHILGAVYHQFIKKDQIMNRIK